MTDSGSNFIKAFSVFGSQDPSKEAELEEDSSEELQTDYLDTFSILEEDSGLEYQLPQHQRCAAHLLNLVATTDAAQAEEKNGTYKWLLRAAFGKCQALWNKTGRSYIAAEIVEDECKLQLVRQNQTRWNSIYMAVERILRILQQEGEDAIRNVCEKFGVTMLSPAEIAFLSEYYIAMKPVVKFLNILQSETNAYMGWLLPVIFQLQAKLRRMEASSKMCLPLIRAIQDSVQKRFGGMMEDPELIAAAILLPKFKTTWTENTDVIEAGLAYEKTLLEQMTQGDMEQVGQHSSDEVDFFNEIQKDTEYRGA
ncbi:hypothetical protein AOLI_G00319980 [Acnodon oligacanthus]